MRAAGEDDFLTPQNEDGTTPCSNGSFEKDMELNGTKKPVAD